LSHADLIFLTLFTGTACSIIFVRKRMPTACILAALITLGGWAFIVPVTATDVARQRAELERQVAAGLAPQEALMHDGVGDNVAALLCGWFPGALGIAVGLVIAIPLRRRERHRAEQGFPVEVPM
jgi:hypothetical protein